MPSHFEVTLPPHLCVRFDGFVQHINEESDRAWSHGDVARLCIAFAVEEYRPPILIVHDLADDYAGLDDPEV